MVVVSFFLWRRTLIGTAIGVPPQAGWTRMATGSEVQAHRVDDPPDGGANGVAEDPGTVHFPAGLVK